MSANGNRPLRPIFYGAAVLASASCSGLSRAGKIIEMHIRFEEVPVRASANTYTKRCGTTKGRYCKLIVPITVVRPSVRRRQTADRSHACWHPPPWVWPLSPANVDRVLVLSVSESKSELHIRTETSWYAAAAAPALQS